MSCKQWMLFFKEFFTRFFALNHYPLMLDSYYYDRKRECSMLIFKVKNKRFLEKIPTQEVVSNRALLQQLGSIDACTIGVLTGLERYFSVHKTLCPEEKAWRIKDFMCYEKPTPLLQVKSKDYTIERFKKITFVSKYTGKESEILARDLYKHIHLIKVLDPLEALSVGYDIGDALMEEMGAQGDVA